MRVKIFILLSILLLILIIWKSNILTIETVKITSLTDCVSQEELNKEIKTADKNWILIDSSKLKDKLTSKFSCIKDINLAYEFPKTVNIYVYGRKFLAKVYTFNHSLKLPDLESTTSSEAALVDWNFPTESSGDAFIVDDTGFVFTKQTNNSLPTLFLTEDINFGFLQNKQYFKFIDQIFSKILTYAPISYQPDFKAKKYDDVLIINTSPKLAFSFKNDVSKQLASLQLILQKAKIDEKITEFIDLRFDKPVVQYRLKSSK